MMRGEGSDPTQPSIKVWARACSSVISAVRRKARASGSSVSVNEREKRARGRKNKNREKTDAGFVFKLDYSPAGCT